MKTAPQRMIAQLRLALVTERTKLRPGNEAPADCADCADEMVLFAWPPVQIFPFKRNPHINWFRIPPERLRPMLRGEWV